MLQLLKLMDILASEVFGKSCRSPVSRILSLLQKQQCTIIYLTLTSEAPPLRNGATNTRGS